MASTLIQVRHNIEVAHRLSQLQGKCERIHGHSMWVTLELAGELSEFGLLAGLDFGAVKKTFRDYLDAEYDHSLLLYAGDPWADYPLPGLQRCANDPTTENIAEWIGQWSRLAFPQCHSWQVHVQETPVNSATWRHE